MISGNNYTGVTIANSDNILLSNNIITKNVNGISTNCNSLNMLNNTITSNSGNGATLNFGYMPNTTNRIYNNIMWGNAGNDVSIGGCSNCTVIMDKNDFDPLKTSLYAYNLLLGVNVNYDPWFANAKNSDYHLSKDSPLVDRGNALAPSLPQQDFEGDPRIISNSVDIGADEYNPVSFTATPTSGISPLSVHFSDSSTTPGAIMA